MRLEAAIEILSRMHRSAEGEPAAALGTAIAALKENLDRVRDDAEEAVKMLRQVLPGPEAPERTKVWRYLRPMLRLSTEVLDEVERQLANVTGLNRLPRSGDYLDGSTPRTGKEGGCV